LWNIYDQLVCTHILDFYNEVVVTEAVIEVVVQPFVIFVKFSEVFLEWKRTMTF
jgi:hypothetical protein